MSAALAAALCEMHAAAQRLIARWRREDAAAGRDFHPPWFTGKGSEPEEWAAVRQPRIPDEHWRSALRHAAKEEDNDGGD